MSDEEQKPQDTPVEPTAGSDLEEQCAQYLQGWKRAVADYENLKRETHRIAEEHRRDIRKSFAQSLLPLADNFHEALKHLPDFTALSDEARKPLNAWLQGMGFIEKQLLDTFAELGVTRIEAEGKPFDPVRHESVSSEENPDKPDQIILKELSPGWEMDGYVLRPAKVIVNQLKH